MNEYSELMQYEPCVGTTKDEQEALVRKSSTSNECAVGIKRFTFDEFLRAIRSGHSIKRMGKYDGKSIPTRFITIDIDDEYAKITEDEIRKIESDRCVVMPSTSGNPYKWHIYVFTVLDCHDTSDLLTFTKLTMNNLKTITNRDCRYDYKLVSTWGQWVYGRPQKEAHRTPLEGTLLFCRQITKQNGYTVSKVDPCVKNEPFIEKKIRKIPFRCKDVAKFLGIEEFKDKTYSIDLFWSGKKPARIKDGFRSKYGMAWVLNLVAQYFKLNKKYGAEFSVEDLHSNLERLCSTFFVDGTDAPCYRYLVSWMDELESRLRDKPYEYIEGMMDGKVHDYKTGTRVRDLVLYVRDSLRFDSEKNTFIVSSRAVLIDRLLKAGISEKTFRRHLIGLGYDLEYESVKRGRKSTFDFEKYQKDSDGCVLVPSVEISQSMRNRASKLGLRLKSVKV